MAKLDVSIKTSFKPKWDFDISNCQTY